MKVTIKGQITVPQALRERYGLHPGTEVEFEPDSGGLRLRARKPSRKARTTFDSWLAHAAGSSTAGLSTDKIMAMTRGED